MKVILPVAGKGTRLLPQTQTKPKCLVPVAGKPILGHVIDLIRALPMEELILVVGADDSDEARIRQFIEPIAPAPVTYVRQTELKGPAHAIFCACQHISEEVFIIYNDTICDVDLTHIRETAADGIIWVKEVEDPRRFGVVVTRGDRITRLVEKPETPPSNLTMVGMYYFKDGPALMKRIERVMKEGRMGKGEFYLPDPLQMMLDEGYHLEAALAQGWYDCGTIEALFDTNRILLERGQQTVVTTDNSVIIPPVYIEDGAVVSQSVIGPYVSIAARSVIQHSVIRDSIISEGAIVQDALLQRSLVGEHAFVKGTYRRLNVGDFSTIQDE